MAGLYGGFKRVWALGFTTLGSVFVCYGSVMGVQQVLSARCPTASLECMRRCVLPQLVCWKTRSKCNSFTIVLQALARLNCGT